MLRPGDVVALRGELGAGKSELARAVIRARAGAAIEVPSPTFTLIQLYPLADLLIGHADLYRLGSADELDILGLDELLAEGALLVEWPERAEGRLPAPPLLLELGETAAPDGRVLTITAPPDWQDRLADLVA